MPGPDPNSASVPAVAPVSVGVTIPLRRYRAALLLGAIGLVITALLARQVDRWARDRDAERFAAACRQTAAMIEQKMERYESALNRLRDVCARNQGEVSEPDWNGWLFHTLDIGVNYANIRCLLVAPRITRADREAFGQRAAAQVSRHPGTILTARAAAPEWLPVWRRWAPPDVALPRLGEDLLEARPQRPSFKAVLSDTYGWVAPMPTTLQTTNGNDVVGFWFALAIRPLEFTNAIRWQRANETVTEATKRRARQRTQQTTGILAAHVDGARFLSHLNGGTNLLQVQLFTSREPRAETLLNPGQPPPAHARFVHDQPMRWYGRGWTARFHSTPIFEAGSVRYRTWLVWIGGSLLSLGMAGAVAWQTRGRLREAALAEQLRQSLSRQERLSRDLHDGTLQSVYGVGLGLQRAQRLLEKRPADAAGQLSDTALALQRVVGELRAFIRESDPTAREEVRLGEALAGVLAHLRLATEMELELTVGPGADEGLTPAQSLQWLNIAREALSNAVRHSHGRRVEVVLTRTAGLLRLEVTDDGRGFDPSGAQQTGHGLRNLAVRVQELGGVYRWETGPGHGARLVVEVPAPTPES